jgi:hypothetical protein
MTNIIAMFLIWTNAAGDLQFSRSASDAMAAVGAVTTSATPPVVEANIYPQPDYVVPTLDAQGNQVGTARILVDAETLAIIAVIDTASPQRPWTEQRAAFAERQQRNANAASTARSVKDNAAKIGNSPVARELERLAELIESIIETPNRQSE